MANDTIIIKELNLHTKIGLTAEERSFPQRVVLNAEIGTDTSLAAETKDVKHSINYAALIEQYKEHTESGEWVLVEELLEDLSQLTLENHPKAQTVSLQLKKFVIPNTSWVGVENLSHALG